MTPRNICEFLINNNTKIFKSRKILLTGVLSSIAIMFALYTNFNMSLNSNFIIDLFLNTMLLSILYIVLTSLMMHLYLKRVRMFILMNSSILLFKVKMDTLEEAYIQSLKAKIKDEQLLSYLQNFSKK